MRSMFAIWSDNGRIDYGVAPRRPPHMRRLAVAAVVFAIAGMGLRTVYSEIVAKVHDSPGVSDLAGSDSSKRDPASRDLASEIRRVADAAPAPVNDSGRPRAFTTKRRMLSKTIGRIPIGSLGQSTIAEPQPFASPAGSPAVASAGQSAIPAAGPADGGPPKLAENKLREKPRAAKRRSVRSAPVFQVYESPDGRPVVMRRQGRNDAAASDPWNNNFTNGPRFGRRIHVARPAFFFEAPF
jgi:hypothetical protein